VINQQLKQRMKKNMRYRNGSDRGKTLLGPLQLVLMIISGMYFLPRGLPLVQLLGRGHI
jgi:hypothetical protein